MQDGAAFMAFRHVLQDHNAETEKALDEITDNAPNKS
jgi:hypothetical protein